MSVRELSNRFESQVHAISSKYGAICIQLSIGVIYIWFGGLKFFAGMSPAEQLAGDTLSVLTFHLIDQKILVWSLALVEVMIGTFLVLQWRSRGLFYTLFLHMIGTQLPFVIFPEVVFDHPPFGFSIEGQYIMKNLVITSALLMIFANNRTTE